MTVKPAGLLLVALALGAALAAPGFGAQARTSSLAGTVGRVDPASRTLDVAGRGGTRTFTVPPEAIVLRQTTLTVSALQSRDYPVLQGIFLLLAVSVVIANLAADVVYGLLDPRVRS